MPSSSPASWRPAVRKENSNRQDVNLRGDFCSHMEQISACTNVAAPMLKRNFFKDPVNAMLTKHPGLGLWSSLLLSSRGPYSIWLSMTPWQVREHTVRLALLGTTRTPRQYQPFRFTFLASNKRERHPCCLEDTGSLVWLEGYWHGRQSLRKTDSEPCLLRKNSLSK